MSYTPVVVFDGINGFALKPPSQYEDTNSGKFRFINRREFDAMDKEFIEITKEKNKLPTVILRTYVLYYRNNGDLMTDTAPGTSSTVDSNENYRFYNDLSTLEINSTWTISNWAQYMTVSNANNKYATSTSGYGLISNQYNYSYSARFDIQKSGNDIIVTCDKLGYFFRPGDTITFKDSNTWLDKDFTFTVLESQIDYPADGRQLGWIWGFPLLDVGRGDTSSTSENWPRWKSGASSTYGGSTAKYPNDDMLVQIANKQNIITLDMSKFQFKNQGNTEKGDGYDDIKDGSASDGSNSLNDCFYMNLRITSSTEKNVSFGGLKGEVMYDGNSNTNGTAQSPTKVGENGNWQVCHVDSNTSATGSNGNLIYRWSRKWATLVEYEYHCELINPKPFLDFSPTLFAFDWTLNAYTSGTRFIQTESEEEYVSIETEMGTTINSYIKNVTLKLKTGLGRDAAANYLADNMVETMSPGNTILGLTLRNDANYRGYANRLKEKLAWNTTGAKTCWTLAKIIGGWYSRGESNNSTTRNIGYYGNIISNAPSDRQTKYDETVSWKNDIELVNYPWPASYNRWPALDNGSKSFTLRNVLWCSLKSPRKIKVKYIGERSFTNPNHLVGTNRYITNFIDLKSSVDSNIVLGGGYARNSNELDLSRKNWQPYFSKYKYNTSNQTIMNSNTTSIVDYNINESVQYLDASSNNGGILTFPPINYYRVQYKLLIPPASSTTYSITYSFGKTNNCVTTFFRFEDMSGTPNPFPDGSNNHFASRDDESIQLTWDAGETDAKAIYIIDVAGGTNNVVSTINSASYLKDASYNDTNSPEIYDLSFNVFQFHFFSRNLLNETNTARGELPYTTYTFDTTGEEPKFIDISYTPINYVPFRYINYSSFGLETPERLFLKSADFPSGPILLREEVIEYNPSKIFPKGNDINTRTNAVIIDPSNTELFPTVTIDISGDIIYDNSFSVVPNQLSLEDAENPDNQGQEIATFDKQNIKQIFGNDKLVFLLEDIAFDINGNNRSLYFHKPYALDLESYLIPDFWRLPNQLNILRTSNVAGSSTDSYRYYNDWTSQIQTTMVFDVLNISVKAEHGEQDGFRVSNILVNTNIRARGSSEYSAITETGTLLNNSVNNIIFSVQGALGVIPSNYLNLQPIIVLVKAPYNGPFGTLGQNFIGNKATAQGGIDVPYPAQPGIPDNSNNFVINTVLLDLFRKGNNTLNGTNLGGSESAYNGIFDITAEVPNKEDYGLLKQNDSFIGTIIDPSPLPVLLVDISSAVQLNPTQFGMLNDENNKVTIEWSGFSFSGDPSWNFIESDVYWTITRYNIQSGVVITLLHNSRIQYLDNKYTFIDTTPVIFSTYRYTITGVFYWMGITKYLATNAIPFLNVPGFNTPDILVCKYNRFPYGRFNTTSTNLKLYAPLRLNTPEGQVDQFNKKTAGGGCSDPNNPGLNLFTRGSRISSSNNIYANTTNQVSKKQTYVILSKSRFRPFR